MANDDTEATEDKAYMLTTIDNPYNPFTQYDEWYALDEARGYHSTGLLARYAITSDELSFKDQEIAINLAINEIIHDNPFGMYKKVTKDDFES
jgi:hypothetical protein